MRKVILAFSGRKQSGKGVCCEFLTRNAGSLFGHLAVDPLRPSGVLPEPLVERHAMARPLKKLCAEVLGLDPRLLNGTDQDKSTVTGYRWEQMPHYLSLPEPRPSGPMTVRQVMQELGTGVFRTMNPFVWTEAWRRGVQASHAHIILADDVRFPDEVDAVHAAGGRVLRLTRDPSVVADTHVSETSLDPDVFDWGRFDGVVVNDNLSVGQTCRLLLLWLIEQGLTPSGVNPNLLDYPG